VELTEVRVDEKAILKHLKLDPNDVATQALLLTCRRYNLDPLLRHALLVEGRLYITRDGLLHVAHSSHQLDGVEVIEQSETQSHWIAKVAVHRKDMSHPFTYVGRYPKVRKVWKGQGNQRKLVEEDHPYGPEMAVKTAEVMGLRRAFDVSVTAAEEMWDEPPAVAAPLEVEAASISNNAEPAHSSPTPASSPGLSEDPRKRAIELRKEIRRLDPEQSHCPFDQLPSLPLETLEKLYAQLAAGK
jgi:hypothetical protein